MKLFSSKSSEKHFDDICLAIGGGAVIDEAKIWAKENGKKLIAIPTTGSGASETSHAVRWGKTKESIETDKPSSVLPPFEVELTEESRKNTRYDILGHVIDYINVCSDNELIELGAYAGTLIEKNPTNLTHKQSYGITLEDGTPHGEALRRIIRNLFIENEDIFTNECADSYRRTHQANREAQQEG